MALEEDALVHRRWLRRSIALWRTLAIVLAVAALAALFGRFDGFESHYIARLNVTGVIIEDQRRGRALEKLIEDDDAKALIVVINSPGGTVVGGEALFTQLREVAVKKPVVAVMGTLATSAGYLVAIGADHIVAHEGTITASIGVIFQSTDLTVLLGRLGIKMEAVKSGPLKATPSPFEKTTPEQLAAIDSLVKDSFDFFLGRVRERRKLGEEDVRAIADGRVVTGRQAKSLKLVDELGGDTEAKAWLKKTRKINTDLPVRNIDAKEIWSLGDAVAGLFGAPRDLAGRLALDGLVSLWHPLLRD